MVGKTARTVGLVAGVTAVALASAATATAGTHGSATAVGHSAWDEQWLMSSIQGDRFEIQGGLIAEAKGNNQLVRDLGTRLVKDHAKSLKEAVALAKRLGIDVPPDPTPSQQWELRVVASYTGADFDRWYTALEVLDHRQDIEESRAEVQKGTDGRVRHLAHGDVPVLRQHLKLSETAAAAVK
jgi:putative membrane protein